MRKKWRKILLWIVLLPILVFTTLIISLYIPPIQNFLRRKATSYASEQLDMQVNLKRIDLRFPLNVVLSEASIVDKSDTILSFERLNAHVSFFPLFKGRVDINDVSLKDAYANMNGQLADLYLKGHVGRLSLVSHSVNISEKLARVNKCELENSNLHFTLNNKDTKEDKKNNFPWRILVDKINLNNVGYSMTSFTDSLNLSSSLEELSIKNAVVNLSDMSYSFARLILKEGRFSYDTSKNNPMSKGFDPSHLAFNQINAQIDSFFYSKNSINSAIKDFSFRERSGLFVNNITGRVSTDAESYLIPNLKLITDSSYINLSLNLSKNYLNSNSSKKSKLKINGALAKNDFFAVMDSLPTGFKKSFPQEPTVFDLEAQGTVSEFIVNKFNISNPDAFLSTGNAKVSFIKNKLRRKGSLKWVLDTKDMSFLTALTGKLNSSLAIPMGTRLALTAKIDKEKLSAKFSIKEGSNIPKQDTVASPFSPVWLTGSSLKPLLGLTDSINVSKKTSEAIARDILICDGSFNFKDQKYNLSFVTDSLNLVQFIPTVNVRNLTSTGSASGSGFDFFSLKTTADVNLKITSVDFQKLSFPDLSLNSTLNNNELSVVINSNNKTVNGVLNGKYLMSSSNSFIGQLKVDISNIDFYRLGLFSTPLKKSFPLTFYADLSQDQIKSNLTSDDIHLKLDIDENVPSFTKTTNSLLNTLVKQLKNRELIHKELIKYLPQIDLSLNVGNQNSIAELLNLDGTSFKSLDLNVKSTPNLGFNINSSAIEFRKDSMLLDTIRLNVNQDSTNLLLNAGVYNSKTNPKLRFKANVNAEISNKTGKILVTHKDLAGNIGVLLGTNITLSPDGTLLHLIPEEPILAFKKFKLNNDNRVFIASNNRVDADVEMFDDLGQGFSSYSDKSDSVSLQNVNVELRKIELKNLSRILTNIPKFSGILTSELHFVQKAKNFQFTSDTSIGEFEYNEERLGDLSFGVDFLPDGEGTAYSDFYLSQNKSVILKADGTYISKNKNIDANLEISNFPFSNINPFVPKDYVQFSGDANGKIVVGGNMKKPLINGELDLNKTIVKAPLVGAKYRLDDDKLLINGNRIVFKDYAIYTTNDNPFLVNGDIDFKDIYSPKADLKLASDYYKIIDSPKQKKSLLYGKAFVDLNARVFGALNNLKMRGDMSLRGGTDLSYVMTNSPLTVDDRLGDLVTFVNFSDTLWVKKEPKPVMSFGGLDMFMTIHVDPAVRLNADLSSDKKSRVALEGGGDLTFRYSPRGDMKLSGRYVLTGGKIKYSLPVIPLKEFSVINGSSLDWTGDIMDPLLNLSAKERMKASVAGEGGSRKVVFDISVNIKNRLKDLALAFDLEAPEDIAVQNELMSMTPEERSKQAITMMATGIYIGPGGGGSAGGGNLNMGAALNSVLQSQINKIAGEALGSAEFNFGMENTDGSNGEAGRTDYSFRYSQRFFNDRFQLNLGGTISTGNTNGRNESFIDNASLEYRLDNSGTRYVRLFYDKNFDRIFEGEITETGVGFIMRRKLSKLSDFFIYKKKK